jgi:tyrosyl-tRNA synthetase
MNEALEKIKRGTDEIISVRELEKKLASGRKLRIKLGVDPTAPDLHLGHTVIISKLKTFQDLGHQIVFLIGDFTARIGDPSGRSETRPIMTDEQIEANTKTYANQVFKILSKEKTEIAYNGKWLKKLGVSGLLNLAAKSTVAQMLVRDDFKKRYRENNPISIVEFLYPLLQAYDSVALNADVELGGGDQKFNLLLGREIQRGYGIKDAQVIITMPLLEGTDGVKKMSKSYKNCIALNDLPKDMFGKIMSISDELMYRYYELLTTADLNAVKNIHPKAAKSALAQEIVERYHGKEKALRAKAEFDKIFVRKDIPDDIEECHIPHYKRDIRIRGTKVEYDAQNTPDDIEGYCKEYEEYRREYEEYYKEYEEYYKEYEEYCKEYEEYCREYNGKDIPEDTKVEYDGKDIPESTKVEYDVQDTPSNTEEYRREYEEYRREYEEYCREYDKKNTLDDIEKYCEEYEEYCMEYNWKDIPEDTKVGYNWKDIPDDIEEYCMEYGGIKLSDLLVKSGMILSMKEARWLIKQGGVRIDLQRADEDIMVNKPKSKSKNSFILQVGKRKFSRIIWISPYKYYTEKTAEERFTNSRFWDAVKRQEDYNMENM